MVTEPEREQLSTTTESSLLGIPLRKNKKLWKWDPQLALRQGKEIDQIVTRLDVMTERRWIDAKGGS